MRAHGGGWRGEHRRLAACVCVFFFSSRRRHTRFDCDWSSDVCSSDLQREGLRIRSDIEGEYVVRPAAVEDVRDLPVADVVLFCVKSFDTETAAERIQIGRASCRERG